MEPILNNLPLQLSSFVGRERETAMVRRLLAGSRLVTLTGPGGVGKTRLALQAAAEICQDAQSGQLYADGVWLMELAPLADPVLVVQTTAAALAVREEPGRPLAQTLSDDLRARRLLLVLDNCEHVIFACAQLAEALLRTCPGVRILATSREALGIAGESTYQVPSLELPSIIGAEASAAPASAGHAHDLKAPSIMPVQDYEAVRLFVERASAARPGFVLSDHNASAIAQICVRLDGIPLAIELAAGYIKSLTPEQLVARLDDRFRLLTSGSRTALPRQQTLRATIEWSYNLLTQPEQVLFRRVSVFAGGSTLEAAEEVCSDIELDGIASGAVLGLLTHLVEKSLVLAVALGGEARYRMLETMRQYAHEKLMEAGEAERMRERHLEYFMQLAEKAEPKFTSSEQLQWLNRFETELDNVRVALTPAAGAAGLEKELRLASALYVFWYTRGHQTECLETLERLLARPEAANRTAARAKTLGVLSEFHQRIGSSAQAVNEAQEALELGQEMGDTKLVAFALETLASAYALHGVTDGVEPLLEQSLAMYRQIGDISGIADALSGLGLCAFRDGEYERARELLAETITLEQSLGDSNHLAIAQRMYGYVLLDQHDPAAIASFLDSLRLNQEIADRQGVAACLSACGAFALAHKQFERSARLFGAVEILLETIRVLMRPYDQEKSDGYIAALRPQLTEAAFKAAWAQGRALRLEQAIAEAKTLVPEPERKAELTQAKAQAADFPAGLTAREVEVLRRLAQGLTDAQIAETLVISPRTVNAHLRSIYGKLDVTTRTAAVRVAVEHKVV